MLDPAHLTRSAGLELRSAAIVDTCRPLREVDLLIVPHELPSKIYEHGRPPYDEVFTTGCFADAERDPGRVKLNHAHKLENVIGKATEIDAWSDLGTIARFTITKTRSGDEAFNVLADGLVTPSVGFTVASSGEEWRGETRRIRKANLHHVGLTADAAHKTSVIAIRTTSPTPNLRPATPAARARPARAALGANPVVEPKRGVLFCLFWASATPPDFGPFPSVSASV